MNKIKISKLLGIIVFTLSLFELIGCHFDKDSQAPNYAADPHCSNIVQQMHGDSFVNQPGKKVTMIQQAQLLSDYETYNCDDISNKPKN